MKQGGGRIHFLPIQAGTLAVSFPDVFFVFAHAASYSVLIVRLLWALNRSLLGRLIAFEQAV